MTEYIIYTDSACDIDVPTLKEWNVKHISLSLTFEDEGKVLLNDEVEPVAFYNRMREGGVAKTAAVNTESFKRTFEGDLKDGKDISEMPIQYDEAPVKKYNKDICDELGITAPEGYSPLA